MPNCILGAITQINQIPNKLVDVRYQRKLRSSLLAKVSVNIYKPRNERKTLKENFGGHFYRRIKHEETWKMEWKPDGKQTCLNTASRTNKRMKKFRGHISLTGLGRMLRACSHLAKDHSTEYC